MNTITVAGTLGRDPELRFTSGGRSVVSFSLAVNRRYQTNGEWQEETTWVNVSAWGDLAEHAAASLTKGSRAVVCGRIQSRDYEAKDGGKRTTTEIVADEIAVSLRWATAIIERSERSNGGEQDTTRTGRAASKAAADGGSKASRDTRPADPIYGDEEPF